MRDAMCADDHDARRACTSAPATAPSGRSADEGETWRQVVANLPDVMVVRAAASERELRTASPGPAVVSGA